MADIKNTINYCFIEATINRCFEDAQLIIGMLKDHECLEIYEKPAVALDAAHRIVNRITELRKTPLREQC